MTERGRGEGEVGGREGRERYYQSLHLCACTVNLEAKVSEIATLVDKAWIQQQR